MRAPGASWAGRFHRRRRGDGLCPLTWPALPLLGSARCGSEVSDSEERIPGAKARASAKANGRKSRFPVPWIDEQGWYHFLGPFSMERGQRCPHSSFPLELNPRRHFQALFQISDLALFNNPAPAQLHTLILLFCIEEGESASCPTGAGP